MALTFYWNANDTAVFDGDPNYNAGTFQTPTASGGVTVSGTAALVGSAGVLVDAGAEMFQFDTTTNIFDRFTGAIGVLARFTTIVGTSIFAYAMGTSGANVYFFRLTSAGTNIEFGVGDPDVSPVLATTTVGTITTGVTYGVIGRWDQPNNLLRIEVYSTPTGTPSLIEGVTNTGGFTVPSDLADTLRFRVGDCGGLGVAGYFDNLFASKTYAEPIQSNFGIDNYTSYSAASDTAIAPPVGAASLTGAGGVLGLGLTPGTMIAGT